MFRRFTIRLLLTLTVLVSGTAMGTTAAAQDALSAFMQAKLVHAQKTLEGLVKEDYEMIAKHSQSISLLCLDEMWAVQKTVEYHERSKEFQRSVYAITDAARERNLEAATLAYVDTTLKCVSCHAYMRKTRQGR